MKASKNKTYRPQNGLVIGRFQCFHKGHEYLIRTALSLCEYVYVYIGSASSPRTKRNPFSYNERKRLIEIVFAKEIAAGRLFIRPLPDKGYGDCVEWGQYVLNTMSADFGVSPDLYITGCDKYRTSWFTADIAPHMDELRLSRKNLIVGGGDCRAILQYDAGIDKWAKFVPAELVGTYEMLKGIYHEIPEE